MKAIVEKHGGTVEVHSAGLGHGSEFIVRLPGLLEETTEGASAIVGSELTILREVLIVDANRDSAQTLAELLRASGHKAHIAYDGVEALEAAERLHPEVVLLDIGLPKLNGYDPCRRIRNEPWGERIVPVALTGYGQERDVLNAQQAGFNFHLVKPVSLPMLDKLLSAGAPAGEPIKPH